jgi:hypothetical protein
MLEPNNDDNVITLPAARRSSSQRRNDFREREKHLLAGS